MSLRIRPMVAGDIDRVVAIAGALAEAPQWVRPAYEAAIAPEGGPRRFALVAEEDAGLVGFAIASLVEPEAELESIGVAQAAQRRGVARALLAVLIQNLQAAGAEQIVLEVRASNHAAAALYQRVGFRPAGMRRGYYRDPVEDALILWIGL